MNDCSQFTRTWVAIDACGYTAQCTQTVFVEDDVPPTVQAPPNVTVDCTSGVSPFQTGFASASDICSAVSVTYTDGPEEGDGCSTQFVRTWIATDGCGNTATAAQLITKSDMTGPEIFNVPHNQAIQCGDIPPPAEPVATDACSGDAAEVSFTETVYENGCRTTVIRLYSATDACGNTTEVSQTIEIEDTEGPEITCPADVLLQCGDEDTNPALLGIAEAFDNCSGTDVTVTYEDSERDDNACPPVVMRVWSAADTCGNVSNCTQRIMWDDQTPPVITCAGDLTVHCSETGLHPDEIGYAEAEDDCSNVNLTYEDSPMQGACPQTFVRTWTAADACGNSAQCSQTITVIDDTPPTLICPPDVNVSCGYVGAPPHITGLPEVSNECGTVSFTYSDGPPSGACPEVFERTWTATDFCGNTAQCVQTITRFDLMPPVVTCPEDAVVQCGEDISPEALGTAAAVDFCNEVSVAFADSTVAGSCPETLLREWTATDACGNTRSCTQTILIADEALPEITCPEDAVLPCGTDPDPELTGHAAATALCGAEALITYTDSLAAETTGHGGESDSETPDGGCGQLRTQTQGGWGSQGAGDNPGAYRDAHFDAAFPEGIILGCDYTLTLTSAEAVRAFLPSGGPASALTENLVNPAGYGNVLAGQLIAATLSAGFDAYDAYFAASDVALGDMLISSGDFEGYTVSEVLEAANAYFGGCQNGTSGTALVRVLTGINESHTDGTGSTGFLTCPESEDENDGDAGETCGTLYRTWTATDGCGNTAECVQVITFTSEQPHSAEQSLFTLRAYPSPTSGPVQLSLEERQGLDGRLKVLTLQGREVMALPLTGAPSVQVDLSPLGRGFYIIQWQGREGSGTAKIFKD